MAFTPERHADFFDRESMTWDRVRDRLEPQNCPYRDHPGHDGPGVMELGGAPNPRDTAMHAMDKLKNLTDLRALNYVCPDCGYKVDYLIDADGSKREDEVRREPTFA